MKFQTLPSLAVVLCCIVFAASGCRNLKQADPVVEDSKKTSETETQNPTTADKAFTFDRMVLLYRSICLVEFDKESAGLVWGMPEKEWIVKNLGPDAPVYLAIGGLEDRMWKAPNPELIRAIGSDRVRSVADAKDGDLIVVIENLDWSSENEVALDIASCHKDLEIVGSMMVEVYFENGAWKIGLQGGCFNLPLKVAE